MPDDTPIMVDTCSTSSDGAEAGLPLDNDFWQFSLKVYAGEGVAPECLSMQESLHIDVNLLLYSAWMGWRGVALTDGDLAVAQARVATWHDSVVRPLRRTRQAIKVQAAGEFVPFRTRLKRLELEAEQVEQALLFRAAPASSGSDAVARVDVITANIARFLGGAAAPHLTAATLALGG
jgi:uncharacterized protein (TIGR02444 family)